MISHRVVSGMEDEDEDDDMDDGGEDSFGEDEDMLGCSDVTSQLAAAGWQHGVELLLLLIHFRHKTGRTNILQTLIFW